MPAIRIGAGRPVPVLVLVVVAALAAVATWFVISRSNVSPAARECARRYAAARSAADTAAVDAHVPFPEAGTSTAAARCGSLRSNARW